MVWPVCRLRRLGPQNGDDRSQRGAEPWIGFPPELGGELSFLFGRNERAEALNTSCKMGGTGVAQFRGPRRVEHDIGKTLLGVLTGNDAESRRRRLAGLWLVQGDSQCRLAGSQVGGVVLPGLTGDPGQQ